VIDLAGAWWLVCDVIRGFHGFGNSFGNTISSGNSLGSWILGKDVGWKFVL